MSAFSERIRSSTNKGFYKVKDLNDINGGEITLTISRLDEEMKMFDKTMDILNFKETGKQLALNQTTAEWLLTNLGDDPKQYPGKRVTLYLGQYKYEGETKLGIRLRLPNATSPAISNTPVRPSATGNGGNADPDDAIPF